MYTEPSDAERQNMQQWFDKVLDQLFPMGVNLTPPVDPEQFFTRDTLAKRGINLGGGMVGSARLFELKRRYAERTQQQAPATPGLPTAVQSTPNASSQLPKWQIGRSTASQNLPTQQQVQPPAQAATANLKIPQPQTPVQPQGIHPRAPYSPTSSVPMPSTSPVMAPTLAPISLPGSTDWSQQGQDNLARQQALQEQLRKSWYLK